MSFNVNKNKSYIISNKTTTSAVPAQEVAIDVIDENGAPTQQNINIPAVAATEIGQYYLDGSDSLANRGMNIGFTHVPTGKQITFKAFITTFNETYSSDWASEQVFGRSDPIYMFKNTSRNISLAWKIPAASPGEAFENLSRLQKLLQFLYPTYTNVQQANTINMSPLIRLKLMNLVHNNNLEGDSFNQIYESTGGQSEGTLTSPTGLLGVIKNISVAHNLESADGVFETYAPKDPNSHSGAKILPKLIEVNLDFGVIHEQTLGWQEDQFGISQDNANAGGSSFPYGVRDEGAVLPGGVDYDTTVLSQDQAYVTSEAQANRLAEYNAENSEAILQNAVNDYQKAVSNLSAINSTDISKMNSDQIGDYLVERSNAYSSELESEVALDDLLNNLGVDYGDLF